MAKRSLKCSRCGRAFALPMHLARHMSSAHGAKTTAKKTGASVGRPAAAGRPRIVRAPIAMNGVEQLVSGMQAHRDELVAQRDHIDTQIEAVDQALSALGTGPSRMSAPGRTKRAGVTRRPARTIRRSRGGSGARAGSLKDYIGRVLSTRGGEMTVKDITDGVVKAGFKSKNKTLDKSVGIALADMPNVVKVKRGVFRAK